MERLKTAPKVVGLKQAQKAVRKGIADTVFLAEDADPWAVEPLQVLCREMGLEPVSVPSMKELAKACHVEVPTACAVLLRADN